MAASGLSAEQLERLRNQFQEYSRGSHYRVNALTIRSRAHVLIRELTAADNLSELSLDDFDRHIWRLGTMGVRNQSFDWHHANQFLAETPPARFVAMLDSGETGFVGNMTWGSAVRTLRAYARGRSRTELETGMRQALSLLLHQRGTIEGRLRQVKDLAIGFGRNISSGLLMAWNPTEHILYNSLSEQFWNEFGLNFGAGSNWVRGYLQYNAFCKALLDDPKLGLQNLVELDIFAYWYSPVKSAPTSQEPTVNGVDISLAQQVILKDQIAQIRRFLKGRTLRPSDEKLCDWVQFCYTFELFVEGYELFKLIDPSASYAGC